MEEPSWNTLAQTRVPQETYAIASGAAKCCSVIFELLLAALHSKAHNLNQLAGLREKAHKFFLC
jgi:hypothetical protein